MSKLKKLGTYCAMVLAVVVAFACTLVFTACGGDTPADDNGGEQGTINNGGDENKGSDKTPVIKAGDVWVFDSVEYTWDPALDEADENYEAMKAGYDAQEALYTAVYGSMKITIGENNQCRMTMKTPVFGENGLEFDDEGNIKLSDTEDGADYTYTIGEDGKVTIELEDDEETDAQDLVINGDKMTFKIINEGNETHPTLTMDITMKLSK